MVFSFRHSSPSYFRRLYFFAKILHASLRETSHFLNIANFSSWARVNIGVRSTYTRMPWRRVLLERRAMKYVTRVTCHVSRLKTKQTRQTIRNTSVRCSCKISIKIIHLEFWNFWAGFVLMLGKSTRTLQKVYNRGAEPKIAVNLLRVSTISSPSFGATRRDVETERYYSWHRRYIKVPYKYTSTALNWLRCYVLARITEPRFQYLNRL